MHAYALPITSCVIFVGAVASSTLPGGPEAPASAVRPSVLYLLFPQHQTSVRFSGTAQAVAAPVATSTLFGTAATAPGRPRAETAHVEVSLAPETTQSVSVPQ